MKIGFFGNQNNYPFTLARAVRRLGHDVLFFVESTQPLHRPEHRYADITSPYPDWIVDVSPFRLPRYAIPNAKRSKVINMLRSCDGVILNHLGPTLLPDLDVPGILLFTGVDLDYFANLDSIAKPFDIRGRKPDWFWRRVLPAAMRILSRRIIPAQRLGIRKAVAVSYFWKGVAPLADAILDELTDDSRRIFFLMADLEEIAYEPPANNDPLRVFCATRFVWKKPLPNGFSPLDDKGSDVMIRGLAEFFRQTGVRLNIRLVRKGQHARELEELAEAEGIGDQITWLDEMNQKQVREEFREADIIFEQFGTSVVGMAGLDAMAMGRPVIANARPENPQPGVGPDSPICHARTPEEVAQQIRRLLDRKEREAVGVRSRQYVVDHYSPERAARLCVEILTAARQSAT